jgi:hypothetical protein
MHRSLYQLRGTIPVFLSILFAGCGGATSQSGKPESGGHHDHAHADIGPNGGHLLELGDGEYHAEWLHDDQTGKITVIILDEKPKEEVPIPVEKVVIEVAIGEARKSYDLPAVNLSQDAVPKASRFEAIDEELLVALKVGEGVIATLTVDIGPRQYMARIEHHEHDAHGHHH